MKRSIIVVASVLLAAGGCEQPKKANIVSSPYKSGVNHSEPVFFNGKHYEVSFAFSAARNNYDVSVAGKGGRKLGGGDGDQKIVEQIGSSALRHFACASGQKAHVVPGSVSHGGGKWNMQARCA